MRVFIRKIVLFFLTVASFFALLLLFLTYINNRALKNYTIPADIHLLITGDSHIQLSINDKQLSNSISMAKPGESTYYTFYKLGPILKKNPSIKKIYLGFSYHTISSYSNDNIYGARSKDIAARYFFILPFSEKVKMVTHNKNNLPTLFRNTIARGFHTLHAKNQNFSFIGGYENTFSKTAVIKESMDKRITIQYYENDTVRDFSYININYLDKIIALCKKRDVELVILNTPIHPYYKSRIPQKFIAKYNDLITKNGLKQIAFEGLKMSDSCFIADGDHLSIMGALLTTAYLNK
jgi:hypothetical protein